MELFKFVIGKINTQMMGIIIMILHHHDEMLCPTTKGDNLPKKQFH